MKITVQTNELPSNRTAKKTLTD